MGKLKLCRICLVENVRMHIVADTHLQEMFEKITNTPFMTEDKKPMLACYFCYARLKQCSRFMMKCLETEQALNQMLNGDYEQFQSQVQGIKNLNGFIRTPTEYMNIVDGEPQVVCVKEELPIYYEPDDAVDLRNGDNGELFIRRPNLDVQIEITRDTIAEHEKNNEQRNWCANNTISEMYNNVCKVEGPSVSNFITQPNMFLENSDYFNTGINTNSYNNYSRDYLHDKAVQTCKSLQYNGKPRERRHKCDTCNKSFTQVGHLKRHILIHTGEKPFKCDICHRSFNQNVDLKRHLRIHGDEKPYKCNICPSSFNEKSILKRHVRTHTGERPFKCDKCESCFTNITNLKTHIRTHTGEKPYKCDICHRNFSQNAYLKSHIRTHTGEKPYQCDYCQRSFNEKGSLKVHIRRHTGEKPYKCDKCPSRFPLKISLMEHIRTHTGEKPYKCGVCDRTFNQKGSLKRHNRIHNEVLDVTFEVPCVNLL